MSRKDDAIAFGVPGGKVDAADGPIDPEHFLSTVRRAVARETREETGVSLPEEGFYIVHQGVCCGGDKNYWQVTLSHPESDWVATQQPGEGTVAWVTWQRLEEGPFGPYNKLLRASTSTGYIPKEDLLAYCEQILAGVRVRPRMYGGSWAGVETVIIDHLGLREFVRAYPDAPLSGIGARWNTACSKVHRPSSGTLIAALAYDGVTDEARIHRTYIAALDEFERASSLVGSGRPTARV